jgi:hypothetical protein
MVTGPWAGGGHVPLRVKGLPPHTQARGVRDRPQGRWGVTSHGRHPAHGMTAATPGTSLSQNMSRVWARPVPLITQFTKLSSMQP